jgi:hypothetical protein
LILTNPSNSENVTINASLPSPSALSSVLAAFSASVYAGLGFLLLERMFVDYINKSKP